MLTRLYVEVLLVDSVLADEVWELWVVGMIPDSLAAAAWCTLILRSASEYRGPTI